MRNSMEKPVWLQYKERSNLVALRFISWVTLKISRRLSYAMLYPICSYYVLFYWKGNRVSRNYLTKILQRKITWKDTFQHYLRFAKNLIDRLHFMSAHETHYHIKRHDFGIIDALVEKNQGCLLMSAHMGSFEVLRALAAKKSIAVKLLMYQENAKRVQQIFQQVNPNFLDDILPIGSPNTLLKAKELVDSGHFIGILGDRASLNEKTVIVDFLGEAAFFPQGPILLASLLKVPLVLFFGINHGDGSYDVYFEKLADCIELPRERVAKEELIQYWMQRYADRIAHHLTISPFNWFNFYDFWKK